MLQNWELKNTQKTFTSFPFNVLKKMYLKPDNEDFTAYVLEMPDWVNIIGFNEEGNILLIRQFRFGTDKIELEIPGGVIESEEKPWIAAQRELEEETGYKVEKENLTQIGVVDANPAIQTNRCYTFFAKNIINTFDTSFDENEIIEYEFATPDEVNKYIRSGKITNTYIIAAFHWLTLYNS